MKTLIKMSAVLGIAAMMVLSCKKDEPKPTPGPDPTPTEDPVADFTSAADGLTVTFTNTSKNATAYKWEFGDGETSKEVSPSHEYASAGEYTVVLTAANADGATNKKEAKVTVAGKAQAYFTATAVEGRDGKYGKILHFDATGSQNAASIAWDFGDGTTGSEFTVDHEFPDFGKYTVKATVTGLGGDTDEYSEEVEAVAHNELLKGGNCEEDDAQYWVYTTSEVSGEYPDALPIPGSQAWEPVWGCTEDGPSARQGGCLQLNMKTIHDQAANMLMYQPIDVKAGDILRISFDSKWGENTNDSGLFWVGITTEPGAQVETGVELWDMFNYWNAWASAPIPPFDGGFAGTPEYISRREELGFSGDGTQDYAEYEVPADGTVYLTIEYRSVWGSYFGEGVKVYIDNISCKIIL